MFNLVIYYIFTFDLVLYFFRIQFHPLIFKIGLILSYNFFGSI